MTHSTVNQERENRGSLTTVFHEINVTSLDVAGEEGYDPSAEVGIEGEGRFGIGVRGHTNSTIQWGYNSTTGNVTAQKLSDGSDIPAGESIGHVTLEVSGE